MAFRHVVAVAAVMAASSWTSSLFAAEPGTLRRGDARSLLPAPGLQPERRVPTLLDVVGHAWGRDVSSHAQMERYMQALAQAAPDRVVLVPYGKTYEGRTLYYMVISSPERIRGREAIRAVQQSLADPRKSAPEAARGLAANAPALVWLAAGIHGDETSGPEAALVLAYHLASDRRAETLQALQNVVVLIDPLQNPDGHDRFVNVYRETRGPAPEANPAASEHAQRWPGGRFNHYLFDMNRDWFLQSQVETRAKAAAYLQWRPHLYIDAHEMGPNSTFFFYPAAEPVNPWLLASQSDSIHRLGRHTAGRFDEQGFAYSSREMFDAFYPGYGSVWPFFQGGLSVLWEQAGVRGLVIDRDDQTQLRLADAVRHHYSGALAAIEFASQNRQKLVQDLYEVRARSVQMGGEGPLRHFFLPVERQADRAAALAATLRANDIEVFRLTKPMQIACSDIRSGSKQNRTIPAGSFHIPLAQPAGRLARTLLERETPMGKEYTERQLRRNAERLPTDIYDVTAWSLPLAFGVDCVAAGEIPPVAGALYDGAPEPGEMIGGKAKVAYLVPGSDAAMRALAAWLGAGLRVHVADRGLRLDGRPFSRGTLILRAAENPEDLHSRLAESVRKYPIRIYAAQSGFVDEGAHPGGFHVAWVRPPKAAMLVDEPTHYPVGHTWHLFDQTLHYPLTRLSARSLGGFELNKYNVLIMPSGNYGEHRGFGQGEVARLRQWISDGGTLILIKQAAAWATNKNVGLLASHLRKRPPAADKKSAKPAAEAPDPDAGDPPDAIPGAFLKADAIDEHWLTFGVGEQLEVFCSGNLLLSPPAPGKGRSVVQFTARDTVLSGGFCWPETLQLAAQSSYLVHQPLGKGHVVAFADDPNFRVMYPASQRLFLNAVLFAPGH